MNHKDFLFLISERGALQRLIAETPAEDTIDLLSLQSRLEEVEQQIARAQSTVAAREPARAQLTFSGRPVIGRHGIFASFGMKAVNSFTEAVTAIAASLTGPLAATGPIPNREQNQMLITNTALGSFGFELEEYQLGQLPLPGPTAVEVALERATDLLQGTIEVGDDLLADSASDLDRRAIDRIRDFVATLAESEAICTLRFHDRVFRFNDVSQVRRSLDRLSQDNLTEEEQVIKVQFLGALPHRKTFEFCIPPSEEVLSGRSSPTISNLDPLNDNRHRTVPAKLMVTKVANGKPRYRLLEMPDWSQLEPPR